METFKTQFMMSGVRTDVTIQPLGGDTFGCTLNLADFFDGGEFEGPGKEHDVVLKLKQPGEWEITGNSKVTLTPLDVKNLGEAIEAEL